MSRAAATELAISSKLSSLGSPIRLRLIRMLVRAGDGGMTVGELQRRLDLPASTHAHHLSALVKAGLVTRERQGREIICTADFRALRGLGEYLLDQCCIDEKKGGGNSAS